MVQATPLESGAENCLRLARPALIPLRAGFFFGRGASVPRLFFGGGRMGEHQSDQPDDSQNELASPQEALHGALPARRADGVRD